VLGEIKSLWKRRICWGVFCLVYTLGLKAQEIYNSPALVHYSTEHGLPSAEVYDMLQDKQGYIWAATDKGVSRFDGTEFVTYTTRDGLTDNTVLRMWEDEKGRLWFITYNRKLCFKYKGKIYTYKYNDILKEACNRLYVGHIITGFFIDADDNLTLAMTSGRVITLDHNGHVEVYEPGTQPYQGITNWSDFEKTRIRKVMQGVTDAQINKPGAVYSLTRGRLRFFYDDENWLTCSPFGVSYANMNSDTVQTLLEDQFVTGFCSDNEGGKWFCTLGNGIYYQPNPRLVTYSMSEERRSNYNASFFYQDSAFLAYLSPQKIFRYQPADASFQKYEKDIDYFKIPLESRREGLKFEWILRVDIIPEEEKVIINNQEKIGLYAFQEVHDSIILISMSSSFMLKATLGNGYIHNYRHMEYYPRIFRIITTYDQQVWLGTIWGLYHFDARKDTLHPVLKHNPLFQSRIQDIAETNDSMMVLATRGRGVLIWDRKKDSVIQIDNNNGLLSNSTNQLLYEKETDVIWVATSAGVSCIRHSPSGHYYLQNVLDASDGLTGLDIRQIAFNDGYLFAGTGNNVIRLPKSDLKRPKDAPIFFLEKLEAGGQKQKMRSQYKLPYKSNDLTISFQGISFSSRGNLKYLYKMEGVDNEWHETKETRVNYGSLPAGTYNFMAKALNTQGVESPSRKIVIEIVPPLWKTWWFSTLLLIAGATVIYLIVRSIINRYKYQAQMERRLNELRSLSLRARMNPHFIFNSLNSVQNYILKNQREEANHYLVVFSRLIRLVLQNSDSLEVSLQKELEMIRLYIDLEKKRLRKDFAFKEDIDPRIDIENCMIPSLLLQPFIENAIWHGNIHLREDGEIRLELKLSGDRLEIEITDNGIGRKAAEKKKVKEHTSFATSITQKRINLLVEENTDTTIRINDVSTWQEYVGTRVTFNIPYKTLR